ncbi:MAG: serine/threonine-protein kinase [Planctomycetota bacterium]
MGTTYTAVEDRVADWIRGLLLRAQKLRDETDPDWKHAYGLAQGVGIVLANKAWPLFPSAKGCMFQDLVTEAEEARAQGVKPGQFPDPFLPGVLGVPADPRAQGKEAKVESLLKGFLAKVRRAGDRSDAAWRHGYGVAQGFGALAQTPAWPPYPAQEGARFSTLAGPTASPAPGAPQPPQAPTPPRPIKRPAPPDDAFRAQNTMLDEPEDDGESFRAQNTMLDEPEDDPEAFRAQNTMLDEPGGGDAGGDEAFRAQATLLDAGNAAETVDSATRQERADSRSPSRRLARRPSQRVSLRDALKGAKPPTAEPASGEITRIGRFQILSKLGKGAMGQVFKGRSPDGEIVAIKVLHAQFMQNQRVRARFVREAKAVERVDDPAVVRFVESGEQDGVGQFIAMEYVEGDELGNVLRRRRGQPLELGTAVSYSLQAVKGIRAAHAAGVIHRDLKPENIMITANGGVKITDFSLARRTQDSMLLTREGQVMGTPHFMAPEQAQGKPVDARADIYSLGALIYVLVTGKFPFPRDNVTDVIQAHCEEPRPDPREHNPQVPAGLVQVIHKAMAIDRGERYASAEAMLAGLLAAAGLPPEESAPEVPAEVFAGELPEGTKLGDYTIQRLLGAGGMGHVYYATDSAQNPIALKVLPPQPGRDPQQRVLETRRFLNEAKLAKRVVSPFCYRILGHGLDDNGVAYIATSFVDGISLASLIEQQGMLPPEVVESVAFGVVQALQDVEAAGLVHRDVTPANIMLKKDAGQAPGAGVVLIDFGLTIPREDPMKVGVPKRGNKSTALFKHRVGGQKDAGSLEESVHEDALFLDHLPGGTPAYMAPEVIEAPALVDVRADLYSLGASLYHAATGHRPYTGDSLEAVMYQQRNQAPPAISQFNADFPAELGDLILQLLDPDPNRRPKSPRLCLNKLERMRDPNAAKDFKPQLRPAAAMHDQVVVAQHQPSALNYAIAFLIGVIVGGGAVFAAYLGGALPPR